MWKWIFIVVLSVSILVDKEPFDNSPILDDVAEELTLTTTQIATKYGYDTEVHYVTTEDGYTLELHRISGGKVFPTRKGKKVVLLQHGLFLSSVQWVMTRPNHGLGYFMADNDYDVWMGNFRGNIYSGHTKYDQFGSASDREHLWSYSWHELGVYDLPATIDYMLNATGEEKLQYVGYSQSASAFLVMCSEKPEYNSKIEMAHLMAPASFMSHTISPILKTCSILADGIQGILELFGTYGVTPMPEPIKSALQGICREESITEGLCESFLFSSIGHSNNINMTIFPLILGHIADLSSLKSYLHTLQLVSSGQFRQYDHGLSENLSRYGRSTPPNYNLTHVRVPTSIYYSINDIFTVRTDVELLIDALPNVIQSVFLSDTNFTHMDFMWGIRAPELVYNPMLNVMNSMGSCSNYKLLNPLEIK